MSRVRKNRVEKLQKRVYIIKGIACKHCNNDKMHTDNIRKYCTKCKKDN